MDTRHSQASQIANEQSANRRTHRRTQLRVKADVTLPGDLTIVGHTLNISAGGLSVEVPFKLEVGQRCEIELNLTKLGGPAWVQVVGEVRHCKLVDDGRFTAGMEFVDVPPNIVELLNQCVWSRLNAH